VLVVCAVTKISATPLPLMSAASREMTVLRGQAGNGRDQLDPGLPHVVDEHPLPIADGQLHRAVPGELARGHGPPLERHLLRAHRDLIDPGRILSREIPSPARGRLRRRGPGRSTLHLGTRQGDGVAPDGGEDLNIPPHGFLEHAQFAQQDRRDPQSLPEDLQHRRIGQRVGRRELLVGQRSPDALIGHHLEAVALD